MPSPWLIDRVCSCAPAGYHDPTAASCWALTVGILGKCKLLDRTLGRLTSENAMTKMIRVLMTGMASSHILHSDRLLRIRRRWLVIVYFFSSRRRHTIFDCDWSSDVCSSD